MLTVIPVVDQSLLFSRSSFECGWRLNVPCSLDSPWRFGVLQTPPSSTRERILTWGQSQGLRLPEEVRKTAPHRLPPFRFSVSHPHSKSAPRIHAHLEGTWNRRGSHETPGQYTHGDFHSDIADIDVVVKHLESKYGYIVTMIVSHSRGSGVAMRYLCTHDEVAANVRCFVNVSGRYRMVSRPVIHHLFMSL